MPEGTWENREALADGPWEGAEGSALRSVGDHGSRTIDGVDIAYWHLPRSSPHIVFLHGNSMCKEVFHRQFDHFAEGAWSLLAIDLPGHGASANAAEPAVQYTIPGYARIVKRLLKTMEIERPVLVGWSLGGNVAIEMAGRGLDLRGLCLIGTPPVGPGPRDFAAAFQPSALASPAMRADATPTDLAAFVHDAFGTLAPVPRHFLDSALRTDGRAREIMGAHWAAGFDGCDQPTVIAGWKGAICYFIGSNDALASIDFVKQAAWRNLWRGEIIEMVGCGHAPFIEHPDVFNARLSEFVGELAE